MNKHQQSGMTTLLITSMLLIVALLFSLASYKNLFYQIKRTQNEVLARQAHWAAEGGLECGYSLLQQLKNIDTVNSKLNIICKNKLGLNSLIIRDISPYYAFVSEFSSNNITKVITKNLKQRVLPLVAY